MNVRLQVRCLLLVPWPLLYLGYWSLYHVKGPASYGFGMGGFASGIISTAYALSLYALNRALVYSKRIPDVRTGDRIAYGIAVTLFNVGALGLFPMLFFLFLGFPFSLPAIVLSLLSLFRWKSRKDELPRGPVKA